MDIKEQLKDIKTQLRLSMNGAVSQSFLTAARLLMKKGDMTERASGELLDQAICAVHSDSYHVRNAALLVIRKYMQHSEEHAFQVCRLVEGMADSTLEGEQMLYNMVKEETEE